jgi:predicted negative regulator of RcsB-dependent stress response
LTELLTEQEQVEQLKKWFQLYGIPALLGVLAGVIIFYGWNYYQSYRSRILSHASRVYDEMLTDRAQNNIKETAVQAEKLFSHYPSTPYGEMAALMLAREAVDQKNMAEAHKHLSWVLDNSHTAAIRQIARLRLARLFIAEQKPDEALAQLKKIDDKSFSGLIDEVLGDAYLAKNQIAEAREAYQHALQGLPNSEEIRPLLEMKLNNLANAG